MSFYNTLFDYVFLLCYFILFKQAKEWYCEESVGRAIIESGVARSELFLVTKQHPRDFGFDRTHQMFATSLANLRTDHIDLFHLHYPQCWGDLCKGEH
jgi:diketogulonate reductase-like aldo/keto reductase